MYGFQNFPTKLEEINISKIPLIRNVFGYNVGFADHTKYNDLNKESVIYASYTLGANIQEIHCVLEEGIERIDYITALDSNRLVKIKKTLEKIKLCLGHIDFRLNDGEKKYLNSRKVPVYIKDFKKGHILVPEDVIFKRVENTKVQYKFREIEKYFGKKVENNVHKDNVVKGNNLND